MITEKFAAAAEEIRPQLFRHLRSLGASRSDAEDAAQEALLRAWEHQVPFTDSDDLLRWCHTVARRAQIDVVRRRSHDAVPADGPCREAESALEAVEWRDVLRTVAAALSRMSPADRRALTLTRGHDRRAARRLAAARCRARQRLRQLVGPIVALAAVLVRVARRGPGPVSPRPARRQWPLQPRSC